MPVLPGPVLVDTNTIIEAHRSRCWFALVARYPLETVETCFEETQTGFQNRRPEQVIDHALLRSSLKAVHPVDLRELARVELLGAQSLDPGERALWAHAIGRRDTWVLCGPDTASMRFGYENNHRARLVSLERLLKDIGHRPGIPLLENYRQDWLDGIMSKLVLGML
jgi:hypothetical protein